MGSPDSIASDRAISRAGSTPYRHRRAATRGTGTSAVAPAGRSGSSTRPIPGAGAARYLSRSTSARAGPSWTNADHTTMPPTHRTGAGRSIATQGPQRVGAGRAPQVTHDMPAPYGVGVTPD